MYNGERLMSLMEGGGYLSLMEQCLTLIEWETVFWGKNKMSAQWAGCYKRSGFPSLLGGWRRESFREADHWDAFHL